MRSRYTAMSDVLSGQTAVVTGGASGNGRAICREFATAGADAVIVADVRETPRTGGTPTHELVADETDARAEFVDCDVSEPSDLESAVDLAREFGGIDVMVNNAGIFRVEEFLDVSEAEFDRLMDVNVKGVFFGCQAAARAMVENGGGAIINMSSMGGIRGATNYATYCTSKGGVRLLTYALADELGPKGIRVNAVHPGIVETAMTTEDVPQPLVGSEAGEQYKSQIPSRRFGQPEDVADACVFLASDRADYVNGESLVVDGGLTNTG